MDIETAIHIIEKKLKEIDYFVTDVYDFIYDEIPDATNQIIVECLRAINEYNNEFLTKRRETLIRLKDGMASSKEITSEQTTQEEKVEDYSIQPSYQQESSVKTYIELLEFSSLDESTRKKLQGLTSDDVKQIKFYFYLEKKTLEDKIRDFIISNPLSDITIYTNKLNKINDIFAFLKSIKQDEVETIEEIIEESNIILVPHGNTSYFNEDIQKFSAKRKEIKLAFDKIIEGYFLKTRDTKPLEGYQDLYEYRHPNGIRILYTAEGGMIYICSLFYKDKRKSIRIDGYYAEAIKRYQSNKSYIQANLENPQFYIEQAELVGQVNQTLEIGQSLAKKGDE